MEKEITLQVDGKKLLASRHALQAASAYFNAMFTSGMKESVADEIKIRDVDPQILQLLIDSAHGQKIAITEENAHSLLRSGSMFQFHDVVKRCADYLMKSLTIQSAVDVWVAGDTFAIKQLCRASVSVLLWDFDGFSKSERLIAACPITLLLTLLERDGVNVASENAICDVVIRWLKHNSKEYSEKEIVKVLLSVRYSHVDVEVVKELTKCASEFVSHFVRRVLDLRHDGEKSADNKFSKQILRCLELPRRTGLATAAIVIARTASGDSSDSSLDILTYNKGENAFLHHSVLPALPKALHGYTVCTVGRNSYFLCGEYGIGSGRWNREVYKWDPCLHSWDKVGTIPNLRRHCKCAVVGTCLYLIGGFGRFRVVLESMDIFDSSTGQWRTGANIPCPVFSAAVCGTSDSIYLFSGSVHRYDVSNDTWCQVMKSFPPGPHSAVERNGNVVLVPENEGPCIEFDTADMSFHDLSVVDRTTATYACSFGDEIFCVDGEGRGTLLLLGGELTKVSAELREGEKVECCFVMPFFKVDGINVTRSEF